MSIPLGDLVEQEIGNRYNQGAGNQTIAQQLQLVSCNGKGKSAWPIDPMSPVNCLYATTTNDCQMQLQRTLQLQLQHKRVSIEAESVDGKCLAFVCLARELYTYIYICISMHILYISTDRLILGVQCGSCLHYTTTPINTYMNICTIYLTRGICVPVFPSCLIKWNGKLPAVCSGRKVAISAIDLYKCLMIGPRVKCIDWDKFMLSPGLWGEKGMSGQSGMGFSL